MLSKVTAKANESKGKVNEYGHSVEPLGVRTKQLSCTLVDLVGVYVEEVAI